MEYQKVMLFLKTLDQPCKCKTKIWAKIYDDARRKYSNNSKIKLKTVILK